MHRRAAPLLLLLLLLVAARAAPLSSGARTQPYERAPLLSSRPGDVLTVISTGCDRYQDWQSVAAAFAWRRSGQPGELLRIANCNTHEKANTSDAMLAYVPTLHGKQVRLRSRAWVWVEGGRRAHARARTRAA
jgi:hypothetical protein